MNNWCVLLKLIVTESPFIDTDYTSLCYTTSSSSCDNQDIAVY